MDNNKKELIENIVAGFCIAVVIFAFYVDTLK